MLVVARLAQSCTFSVEVSLDSGSSLTRRKPTPLATVAKVEVDHEAGDLVWEVGRAGIIAYLPGSAPQRFPEGSRLEADGTGYRVVEPTRISIVPTPPGIPPGSQYEVVEDGDTVRFFDGRGGIAAQLPNGEFVRQSGDDGPILLGEFPRGTGNLNDPFRAVLLRSNRRLLLIRRE